jgi:nicotinamidase-related amidase
MQSKYTIPTPERSALLTIDVQRDFANPGAVAEIQGTNDRVPAMRRVLDVYRQRRLPIVHAVRLYLADGTNADLCRREMVEGGKSVVLPGSHGAEIVDLLKRGPDVALDANLLLERNLQLLAENEWAMYKPRWDAFHRTPLEKHLRDLAVTTVVVVGCNFPNCPRATIYGASMRDFRAVLVADAVSGVYDQGLKELNSIGVATPSSEEYVGWLAGSPSQVSSQSVT